VTGACAKHEESGRGHIRNVARDAGGGGGRATVVVGHCTIDRGGSTCLGACMCEPIPIGMFIHINEMFIYAEKEVVRLSLLAIAPLTGGEAHV